MSSVNTDTAKYLQLYCAACQQLGGNRVQAEALFEIIDAAGNQPRRFFHNTDHFMRVAGYDEAKIHQLAGNQLFSSRHEANRTLAGAIHDIIYQHVDRKSGSNFGFLEQAKELIEELGSVGFQPDGNALIQLHHCRIADRSKRLISCANIIFGFEADAHEIMLKWSSNQNEYLSALCALAAGLKMQLSEADILSQIALIEATVPFGAPNRLPKLRERLSNANAHIASPLNNKDIDELMAHAEILSNTDVGDFQRPFENFVIGSFNLLLENSMGHVDADDARQIDPVMMATAMSGMAGFLKAIADASQQTEPNHSIFHRADGQRHKDEHKAIANVRLLHGYLREASTNLQLLINEYTSKHVMPPENWGNICDHLNANQAEIPRNSAHDFFHMLGDHVMLELVSEARNSGNMQITLSHLHQIKNRQREGVASA